MRNKITDGSIRGGTKLISSRELAGRLHIARGIVIEAYDQLKMEGYLIGIHGSGTYVREDLVWKSFEPAPTVGSRDHSVHQKSVHKRNGKESLISFLPGMPDMDLFPRRQWLSCYRDAVEYADIRDLEYAPSSGNWDLRQAIVHHLNEMKGINTRPENIVITAGSSQAFAILAQIFDKPDIALEDPQADFVYRIFKENGCRINLIPVDEQGIRDEEIPDKPLDLIYVTPTHQFPLGGSLSAERRIALLRTAQKTEAWIIEDDFDSEFRYQGKPVAPLQTMAPERIIYIGTFSKIVSPALRIGFMVLPSGILSSVIDLKSRWDFWNEGLQQKAMSLFIERGHLGRHIAKAHKSYRQKNIFIKDRVKTLLSPQWKIKGATTGMHLALHRFNKQENPINVEPVITELRNQGILVESASSYCRGSKTSNKHILLIGFGKRNKSELEKLIKAIAEIQTKD